MSEMLPMGWYIANIESIISNTGIFIDGDWVESKDQDPNGKIRLLQLADIGDGAFINKSNRFVNEEAFSRLKCTSILPGDVLVARMPFPLGRACVLPAITYKAITVVDVCIIRPNKMYTNATWLMYFVNASEYRNKIEALSSGTTRQRISRKNLGLIPLPLPPFNEQKRIVAKLDAIIPRIDSVKSRLDKVPAILKRFRQSVLTAAVTGKLTEKWREENPDVESAEKLLERIREERVYRYQKECEIAKKNGDGKPKKPENLNPSPLKNDDNDIPISWVRATFCDISSTRHYAMSSGPFGSALGTKDYQNAGIPVIRGQNIQPGKFSNLNYVYISEAKAEELNRSKTQSGDIVIVAVGAGVGNSAIIPDSIKSAILSQNCNKFTIDSQVALNSYILSALQISIIRTQMDESTTDTARQFLSLTNLKNMFFPLPPLEEQHEIVRQVEKLLALADKLEQHYQKAKARVDKLSQSVLAKAFRGELVPQDPTDEPAEKLLERIMAEKEKLSQGAKSPREKKKRQAVACDVTIAS